MVCDKTGSKIVADVLCNQFNKLNNLFASFQFILNSPVSLNKHTGNDEHMINIVHDETDHCVSEQCYF